MKVYLSVPMIQNRALGRAHVMAKAIQDAGHEIASPWVLGPLERQDVAALNVFERDRKGAEGCDALVADVTVPSVGVGMEIMAAYKAGKRVILVSRRGGLVSRMLIHMEPKESVEYETEKEVYDGLLRALKG